MEELEILRKQNERLKEALEYYSTGNCHDDSSPTEVFIMGQLFVLDKLGKLARQALKECEEIMRR